MEKWTNIFFPHFWLKNEEKIWIFALKIVFWLYMLKKGSYRLLNIIFVKFIFGDQIHILSVKINKNAFLKLKNEENIRIFALKILFWLYMLKVRLYSLTTRGPTICIFGRGWIFGCRNREMACGTALKSPTLGEYDF